MRTPKPKYEAVPTEEVPRSAAPWPKNPDEASCARADDIKIDEAAVNAIAINEIAAAPVVDTQIKESFLFDVLREIEWELRYINPTPASNPRPPLQPRA
jgi:hypothetical protein